MNKNEVVFFIGLIKAQELIEGCTYDREYFRITRRRLKEMEKALMALVEDTCSDSEKRL